MAEKQQNKEMFSTENGSEVSFIRVVRRYGQSRSLALGPVIPKDWLLVRVELVAREGDAFTILVERLK